MKLLMMTNDTTFAYNLRREILFDWIEKGHEVYLVAEILNFEEEFRKAGVKLVNVTTNRRNTNPVSDIFLYKEYYNILKKINPDMVFTNNIKPNIYGGLACKQLHIDYVENITGLGTAVENPGVLQALTTKMYKVALGGAKHLFFQNSENYDFFIEKKLIPKSAKSHMLPGSGVNLENHPVLSYPDGDKIHFLFIARILQAKGIDQYLGAAKALTQKRNDLVFHICGHCDSDSYMPVLNELQENGVIIYHGEQKNMTPFLEQASCIVHPSYYPEGMSNVLLEAASSGRPIIAADRSGCRETLDDGKTGFIVPIKDTEAVIRAIEKFLDMSPEERRNMGLLGREKMEKEFDRRLVVEEYNKLIEENKKELVYN